MTTTTISLDQKVRNRDPKVAKKMKDRRVMNRAWEISKNSYNAHNASGETVAKLGAAKSSRDFFTSSLQLAWDEEKSNTKIYVKVVALPRKVMPNIHKALRKMIKSDINDGLSIEERNYELAKLALETRHGKNKVTDLMLDQILSWAFDSEQVQLQA
jgi:hypothetical protein